MNIIDFKNKQTGFTLLELMIAVSIMAVLSLFTQQAIQSGLKSKSKIEIQLREEGLVLNALRLMQFDIAMSFHSLDINAEMKKSLAPPTPALSDPLSQPQVNPNAMYATQFQGKANELYMTTLSHSRTTRDSKESDFAVVGYYLKPCKTPGDKKKEVGNCLWRKINFYPDLDITRGGRESVLLENVQELKFRYLGPTQTQLMDRWVSGPQGEDFSRTLFPIAVEVELKVARKSQLKAGNKNANAMISRKMLVALRFPNNPAQATGGFDPITGQPLVQPGQPGQPNQPNQIQSPKEVDTF